MTTAGHDHRKLTVAIDCTLVRHHCIDVNPLLAHFTRSVLGHHHRHKPQWHFVREVNAQIGDSICLFDFDVFEHTF